MKFFRRLTAAGSSALSIWELDGGLEERRVLFGAQLPSADVPLRLDRHSLPFDEALLWAREDGKLECHLHGGFGVAAAFRDWLGSHGWEEMAAEENSVMRATSPLAARVALAQEDGRWEQAILACTALASAERRKALDALGRWRDWASILETPPRVVLAGAPDVGKSSLFNLWHRASLATTASGAGTTRDPVAARLALGSGWDRFHVDLVDSAGIGPARDALDAAAMEMSRGAIEGAWRVLWVLDQAKPPSEEIAELLAKRRRQDLLLLHRTDLEATWNPADWGLIPDISGHLGEGEAWIRRIEAALLDGLGAPPPADAVVPMGPMRRRHLEALLHACP